MTEVPCYCDRLPDGRRCHQCYQRRDRRIDVVLFGWPFAATALILAGSWWFPLLVAGSIVGIVWTALVAVMAVGAILCLAGGL